MRDRLLIVRNVLKCWAIPVVLGVLLGALGWKLGGYRVSILFAGSIVLLAAAVYTYADRIVMGMLGARELVQGEAPALYSTVERLALAAGIVRPKLYVLPDSYPRALSAGRGSTCSPTATPAPSSPGAAPAAARRSRSPSGCSAWRRRRSSRGSSRTSSRTCAVATSSCRRSRS